MDRGAWWATSPQGHKELDTTEATQHACYFNPTSFLNMVLIELQCFIYTMEKIITIIYFRGIYNMVSLKCLHSIQHRVCTQSCPTLCDPHILQPTRLLCPWIFPGKNTEVSCLPQGICPTQRLNMYLIGLLHWQVDSLPLSHLRSPYFTLSTSQSMFLLLPESFMAK